MALTLAERFGTNATIDTTTPSAPKLVIDLTDFQNTPDGVITAGGLDDATGITLGNVKPDQLLAALLILARQNQPATDNDATVGVYVNAPTKSIVTRNGVSQVRWSYTVNVYIPDTTIILDADNVI